MLKLIVAKSKNNVIGKDNKLLWKLKDDMKHFRTSTTGKIVVMGRKTYESMGSKDLPNRENWILSNSPDFQHPHKMSLKEFWKHYKALGEPEVWVCGGEEIYNLLFKDCSEIWVSSVDVVIDGDAYFNCNLDENFKLVSQNEFSQNETNEHDFSIKLYQKK